MMWKDTKYLLAYLAPLAGYLGIYFGGIWSLGSIYIGFVMIPFLEIFLPGTSKNLTKGEESTQAGRYFFDILLYLNIPILWGLIAYYFYTLEARVLSTGEIIGMTLNVGLVVGTIGINVAHELGHRTQKLEQWMAQSLLLSALYMHFFIEHNRGHHKNVGTDQDPASAKAGENIYAFWVRSITGSYINAWKLEKDRLKRAGLPVWSPHNQMLRFQVLQGGYLLFVFLFYNLAIVGFAVAIALIGILLLESVNYIEHYGLRRKLLAGGRYEPVQPCHSWNSDHELGRIFLYELTRHSDHHYKATRKYQVLRHLPDSHQLPTGYPDAIILALIPPVWFRTMNRLLPAGAA